MSQRRVPPPRGHDIPDRNVESHLHKRCILPHVATFETPDVENSTIASQRHIQEQHEPAFVRSFSRSRHLKPSERDKVATALENLATFADLTFLHFEIRDIDTRRDSRAGRRHL